MGSEIIDFFFQISYKLNKEIYFCNFLSKSLKRSLTFLFYFIVTVKCKYIQDLKLHWNPNFHKQIQRKQRYSLLSLFQYELYIIPLCKSI
jgi:hypothetical protein